MRKKLTAKYVETLAKSAPPKERLEIVDILLRGFSLIRQPKSGSISWAARYRLNGRPDKYTIGSYPSISLKDAREIGAQVLRAVAEGRNPKTRPARSAGGGVEDVVEQFMERYVRRRNRPRTVQGIEGYARGYVLPAWKGRRIGSITRADVRALLERIVDDAPVTANRVFSFLSKLFNWCVEQDLVATSPVAGVKRPTKEVARDRVLSDQELAKIWHAAGQLDPVRRTFVQLLILTAQRRGEVAGMMWDEIDLQARLWALPKERTKNGRRHDIPLSPQAVAIINNVPRLHDHYVLSAAGRTKIASFGRLKDRLDALSGVSDWSLQDIRRSAASNLARMGTRLEVTESLLNHISGSRGGIVAVYQKYDFADEKRAALDKWADRVAEIVKGSRQ